LKILIIRLSSIGDIILTTPVLEALKTRYPDAVLDFLVMADYVEAVQGNAHIDHIIPFKKTEYKGFGGMLRFSRELKKNGYDLVVDLHAKLRSRVICTLLGTKVLRYKKRLWWKNILVPLRMITYRVDDTIVRNYFKPLACLGIFYAQEKLAFHFEPKDREKFADFRDFIVMAPGAANQTKKWPKEYFAELGRKLSKTVMLVGGEDEFEESEWIRSRIGDRCINLAGKLSLKESGALISQADWVVANDSAPFHIARALNKTVFVIFGPTDPNMFEYYENTVLLYEALECSPCALHGGEKCPKGHFQCMKGLTPDKVYAIIKEKDL
jgi:lipopolysaccharide heptosyltransferase II